MSKVVVGVVLRDCICCGREFTMPHSRKDRLALCSTTCREERRLWKARKSLDLMLFDEKDRSALEKHIWIIDSATGYARTKVGNENISMHRLIMGLEKGDQRHVDHRNGNKIDNRRDNLRLCNRSENAANTPGRSKFPERLKGVYWHERAKKWCAGIKFKGEYKYLGLFGTEADAHEAYRDAAEQIHGEFANFGA